MNSPGDYVIGKQKSNESTYQTTMEQNIDKTKQSLGNLQIKVLHNVSGRYRHDLYSYLNQWLVIQANIRDKNTSR